MFDSPRGTRSRLGVMVTQSREEAESIGFTVEKSDKLDGCGRHYFAGLVEGNRVSVVYDAGTQKLIISEHSRFLGSVMAQGEALPSLVAAAATGNPFGDALSEEVNVKGAAPSSWVGEGWVFARVVDGGRMWLEVSQEVEHAAAEDGFSDG